MAVLLTPLRRPLERNTGRRVSGWNGTTARQGNYAVHQIGLDDALTDFALARLI